MHIYDKRRFFALLFILSLIAGGLLAVRFGYVPASGFSLQAPASVSVGDELTVVLRQDDDERTVTAAALVFVYDATMLELKAVAPGNLLPVSIVPASLKAGRASITLGSGTAAQPGPGILASLTFKTIARGTAVVALDATSQAAAVDEASNVLPVLQPVTILAR